MRDKVEVDYTNYRGERASRIIQPHSVWYGSCPYHKDGKQWFLRATDMEKGELREFAMKDIHAWKPLEMPDV